MITMIAKAVHGSRAKRLRPLSTVSSVPAPTGKGSGASRRAMALAVADARVEVRVEDVDAQVHAEHDDRLQENDRLEQRVVAKDHRFVRQPSDARPREHGF